MTATLTVAARTALLSRNPFDTGVSTPNPLISPIGNFEIPPVQISKINFDTPLNLSSSQHLSEQLSQRLIRDRKNIVQFQMDEALSQHVKSLQDSLVRAMNDFQVTYRALSPEDKKNLVEYQIEGDQMVFSTLIGMLQSSREHNVFCKQPQYQPTALCIKNHEWGKASLFPAELWKAAIAMRDFGNHFMKNIFCPSIDSALAANGFPASYTANQLSINEPSRNGNSEFRMINHPAISDWDISEQGMRAGDTIVRNAEHVHRDSIFTLLPASIGGEFLVYEPQLNEWLRVPNRENLLTVLIDGYLGLNPPIHCAVSRLNEGRISFPQFFRTMIYGDEPLKIKSLTNTN